MGLIYDVNINGVTEVRGATGIEVTAEMHITGLMGDLHSFSSLGEFVPSCSLYKVFTLVPESTTMTFGQCFLITQDEKT